MPGNNTGRCGYEKDDGETCRVDFALCKCHGQCFHHAPCRQEERREARKRGGRNAHAKDGARTVPSDEAPPPPETLEDAVVWASWATYAVATGRIDARTGHEIGYLLRALQDGLKAVDVSERVEELREQVAELKKTNLKAV